MRPRPLFVAVAISVATCASAALSLADGFRWLDWLFGAVVYSAVLLVIGACWSAIRATRRERRTAAVLEAVDPAAVARRAVTEERQRLSRDIEACVRDALTAIAQEAAAIDALADPRPALVRIQGEANKATTELRRQLGLLRAEEASESKRSAGIETPSRLRRGDVLLALSATLLAAADLLIFGRMEGVEQTVLTVLLTLALPILVIWWRVAPVGSALAAAGLLTLGAVIDQPVQDGFSLVLVTCVLVWSCAATATVRGWVATFVLTGALLVSRLINQPENAPVAMALLLLALVGGATIGRSRRRRDLAQILAGVRRRAIRAAVDEAVGAERRMVARELHDVVSHAVSVIAIQAGAAELSWPTDPISARRAIELVRSTAEQTVTELTRLEPGVGSIHHDADDLRALVNRMRAARLSVTFDVIGTPRNDLPGTVYRVVQESLTNALRYAPGSHVAVHLEWMPDRIEVRVADDGPGPAQGTRRGYGLIGLSERLKQVGGTLVIRRAPEVDGFEVAAVLPTQVVGAS